MKNDAVLIFTNGTIYKYDKFGVTHSYSSPRHLNETACGRIDTVVYCAGGRPRTTAVVGYDYATRKFHTNAKHVQIDVTQISIKFIKIYDGNYFQVHILTFHQ